MCLTSIIPHLVQNIFQKFQTVPDGTGDATLLVPAPIVIDQDGVALSQPKQHACIHRRQQQVRATRLTMRTLKSAHVYLRAYPFQGRNCLETICQVDKMVHLVNARWQPVSRGTVQPLIWKISPGDCHIISRIINNYI